MIFQAVICWSGSSSPDAYGYPCWRPLGLQALQTCAYCRCPEARSHVLCLKGDLVSVRVKALLVRAYCLLLPCAGSTPPDVKLPTSAVASKPIALIADVGRSVTSAVVTNTLRPPAPERKWKQRKHSSFPYGARPSKSVSEACLPRWLRR